MTRIAPSVPRPVERAAVPAGAADWLARTDELLALLVDRARAGDREAKAFLPVLLAEYARIRAKGLIAATGPR